MKPPLCRVFLFVYLLIFWSFFSTSATYAANKQGNPSCLESANQILDQIANSGRVGTAEVAPKVSSGISSFSITSPENYLAALQTKGAKPGVQVQGLTGRILRGSSEADFKTLSPDPERKLVMFMESHGLGELIGLDGYQMLKKVGYPESDIRQFVKNGTRFRLVVFPAQPKILPATWENLVQLVKASWPNSNISEKIQNRLPELKRHSGPEGYKKIMELAPSDSVKVAKMTAVELEGRPGSLWEVRKFLHDQLNLNPLYMGDGYTYSNKGSGGALKREVPEYFGPNEPVSGFENAQTLDIQVNLPE